MDPSHVGLYLVQSDFTSLTDAQYDKALSVLNKTSRERAQRFLHRADAWRFVLGRILRHVVIWESLGESLSNSSITSLVFKETSSGKPYLDAPSSLPALGFNLSHDANAILLAVNRHKDLSVARNIGVDVMRVAIPKGETVLSFTESISITLVAHELDYLRALIPGDGEEATRALFKLWTLKEAYTKALGLGLGFNMTRIEYDFATNVLKADGMPLTHWRVHSSHFKTENNDEYVTAVCHRLHESEDETGGLVVWENGLAVVNVDVQGLIAKMEQFMLYSEKQGNELDVRHRLAMPRVVARKYQAKITWTLPLWPAGVNS